MVFKELSTVLFLFSIKVDLRLQDSNCCIMFAECYGDEYDEMRRKTIRNLNPN